MANFKEISTKDYAQSPFDVIGNRWMLISAEANGECNTMTASWGGFGVLWGKDVATVYIRPERFTEHIVAAADGFSLCVLGETYRDALNYLGTASGRDENKIERAKLTVLHDGGIPYFEEADTVLICKKLYAEPFKLDRFVDPAIPARVYPQGVAHVMYIGEVQKLLLRGE